ncbi:BTAD domain-containing putative transcriptional regulator [Mycobacterium sp. Aquia_213]|nr:BTAD domain-containing putative transcriptional regulator [Mycobacterium sp. Aquia_213]WAC94290.1 BTAD domain-containing putative transcriptional regulator [Mycobacterium sp. Aquia_213]
MLGLHDGSVVPADALIKLLWGDDPPRTAAKALQTHISSLRRALGDGLVLTEGAGWRLHGAGVDASRYTLAAKAGRDAAAVGDTSQAVAHLEEALVLWRGSPELPDGQRGVSEKTRWIEGHAALVEDRADALLATGRAAEVIGDLEAAVAEAPLRERRWSQLMLALYRAGRQGEALGAYQRVRSLLADELGVDPGPELRRLETAIVAQDASLDVAVTQHLPSVTRAVTFLLTDIEGSTAAWEADSGAMAVALARHDELVEQVVTSRGGRLIKTRGEGDATFSVFERPSAAAAAAIELQDTIIHEPWPSREPIRVRMALHTGEVELRDGDYFGRAVNRVARLRSLAEGGQILCSGATAELVIDSLADDVMLNDLGMRQLKNLARPEHVFELRLETAAAQPQPQTTEPPMERPGLPAVLVGPGPFVGRGRELERLLSLWQTALAGGVPTVLIAGEPGVGKTRLAGEWSQQAYAQGAVVLYGRCDEDLGAPYQPFAEALRSLVPCMGADRLRGLRGVEALLLLAPGLTDVVPDLAPRSHPDPDTERYALFDAVVALLETASKSAPVLLILDDLHWAAKPTLLLLRHLLRFGDHARVQIVGTYRSTDLDRSHPLAAMLADLHRDGTANRLSLSGLDEEDVTTYVAEAGYDDEELAHALASVTGGNPFFLIEALRHVDESGGVWDQSTLPQGVREAVSRRLSRLPAETNKALAAAAVVGSRFALELVESVVGNELIDAFDEACQAGIVIEEPGGNYRFNHAIVRQSLLAELASVRRMRLHQKIAATLETLPGADDELLAELAHHYYECAWAGNAAKAVLYCRRAADQAMARLAYEGAADLYRHALHSLEELDDELPDRDDQTAELLIARCEALLAAGDVTSAAGAVSQLQATTVASARLAAWATCFDGQLSMLIHPERLDEAEVALGAAAAKLAQLDDAAGEAKAHTVRAGCLARLGRIADCEIALDDALTAARRAREHRRVNAVLAGAPLAALWGPNPVPRAGGRCLDVVRLLRITTDSPAVEATSTRCQAVLEAFRGRAAAARRMIDSARRAVTELGLRHARLEVEQFAGIVELIVDDPAAAESHLRKAYNGFRRMGLDADTAETAALLGRTCLALDREAEADELCTESERLAGHALKASMGWRTLRAHLLARSGDHEEARRFAEAAVSLAERTDALVDHGDACFTLATVLAAAGNVSGARAAAEQAVILYERKGAAALAEMARGLLDGRVEPPAPAEPEAPHVEFDNACVRAVARGDAAFHRGAFDEFEGYFADDIFFESRRKILGFDRADLRSGRWPHDARRSLEMEGTVQLRRTLVAVRGERLALYKTELSNADVSPGAPRDEVLQLVGIDEDGRFALDVWFDIDDIDGATAELDAAQARFEEAQPPARRLENTATRVYARFWSHSAARDWDAAGAIVSESLSGADHRRVVNAGDRGSRETVIEDLQVAADLGFTIGMVDVVAIRGERLALTRVRAAGRDPETVQNDALNLVEIDTHERITSIVVFDLYDVDAAFNDLDARYLCGEAAPYAHTWTKTTENYAALSRHELPTMAADAVTIDHRRAAAFAPGELLQYLSTAFDQSQRTNIHPMVVHRLTELGAVITHTAHVTSRDGFDAEFQDVIVSMLAGNTIKHFELYDEADLDSALARFEELSRSAPRLLENSAFHVGERILAQYAIRDWDAMAEKLAENFSNDDRRRVVGAGARHGRDAEIASARATADLFATSVTATVIATRGWNLVLTRLAFTGREDGPEAFTTEVLSILEIDAGERVVALVTFDVDDFDSAIAELESRYVAGEASSYANTWSAITGGYGAFNKHQLPAMTPGCESIDHRRGSAFAPGDFDAYLLAGWNLEHTMSFYIETVHRLNALGGVITGVGKSTSETGFDAEWRTVDILTFEDDKLSRCELFDEADLDTAIARFEQLSRPAQRLENAASRADQRFWTYFAARDWLAMAELFSDSISTNDRRRVVNAGVLHGRDVHIENMRALAEIQAKITSAGIATRGERLALSRIRSANHDLRHGEFGSELLYLIEVDGDERIAAGVFFDLDDFDAAIAELDARYLAGEAAAHARIWSLISGSYAAINRHEQPATTTDWITVDHRRETAMGPCDLIAYLGAGPDPDPDNRAYVEAVHRLTDPAAVVTYAAHETSQGGFDAEWRGIAVFTVERDRINRTEVFDEADLDAALARFDQLSRPAPRLENTATRVFERLYSHVAADQWHAVAQIAAENVSVDDRRRVVNAGILHGRDANIKDAQATVGVGFTMTMLGVLATRGERLALTGIRVSGRDPEAIQNDALQIMEIDAEERIAGVVVFDLEDFDGAIAELDARYLAGEAAAYARTWSVISNCFATLSRHELPSTTTDLVDIDHRQGAAFAPGELMQYLRAGWEVNQSTRTYVEVVHRLNNFGAVVTHAADLISRQGFEAEWRSIDIFTIDSDEINRAEVFDEADLDAALARFDELHRQTPRLANTATQAYERIQAHFAARDWDAMTEALAHDVFRDDRRRLVGAELRKGRDATVAEFSALAEIGVKRMTFDTIAIRGSRLVLSRAHASGRDPRADAFRTDVLSIAELDTDERIAALITFDPDEFDAALAELDARYLAGEAAQHSAVWSVVMEGYAALNRNELPLITPDAVNVDHRRGRGFAPGDLPAYLEASWKLMPQNSLYIADVHRLNDVGAVVTHVVHGTTAEGFEAEWREIAVLQAAGDRNSRCEMFDEEDFDAALARFEELNSQARRLENAATRVNERIWACFNARDWHTMNAILADDTCHDDRRRMVGAGVRHGRDAQIQDMQAIADIGVNPTIDVIATRGERLALTRARFSGLDSQPQSFLVEVIAAIEIDSDDRLAAIVGFDADDMDAAFEELDARFMAGAAALHARTWSVVASSYAAFNRHEVPAADWVTIDHRQITPFEPSNMTPSIRTIWDLTPNLTTHIEAVHRLNNFGAVITHEGHGTSQEGFDAEWRAVDILMVDGDSIIRCEVFDEEDLDNALARFDELCPPTPRLENTASQVAERFLRHFAVSDWDAMAEILADNFFNDDRRPLVSFGVLHGRDAQIANMRAIAELLSTDVTSTVIATRAARLALVRLGFSVRGQGPDAFQIEALGVVGIDTEDRIAAFVVFDPDDFDAALAELDARYLAGEGAAHAHTWSLVMHVQAAYNRHEVLPTTADWVNIDHRRGRAFTAGDTVPYLRATYDVAPNVKGHIEAVHRLNNLGVVVTAILTGTSQEGFDAEWREVALFAFEGDVVRRFEIFDEADLDAALARFEELQPSTGRLENVATRVQDCFYAYFAAHDWAALAGCLTDASFIHDRRSVVNAGLWDGRDVVIANMRALAVGGAHLTSTVLATRGERLALTRICSLNPELQYGEFGVEMLIVVEIHTDDRIAAQIMLDPDDIVTGVAELDARYLAGEGASHSQTWSVIARNYAALNRGEVPQIANLADIDHRRGATMAPGDLIEYLHASFGDTTYNGIYAETVHRLTGLGTVFTHVAKGTSQDGFVAEWRMIIVTTVEGDTISRGEIFDEADLDAALARFKELES